jgi:glycosyltransferase involved in cell wall biosynthesis
VNSPDPFLLILKNGPIYSIDDYVGYQLEVLSKRFCGELWVTGDFNADQQVGRFRVRVVKQAGGSRAAFFKDYFQKVLARAQAIDAEVAGPKVVMSYDPFRNGLLAKKVKSRVAWPMIIEVNGAFGNPDNYADSTGFMAKTVKPRMMRALGRYVLSKADGIRLLYNEQLTNFAVPKKTTIVRQYFDAVPLERFQPGAEENFILQLGFPFRRKGVDILLAAFEKVRAEFPTWRLVIIGHDLQRHVPHVPEGVTIMKAVNNIEAADWVRRCSIYVLASRSEAMGRVLIEAAAAAKPRVVSDVDGTYAVVRGDTDGILFEKANVDALANALRELMSDPARRKQLGAAARERALVDFSGDTYVNHVAGLVGAVLAKR